MSLSVITTVRKPKGPPSTATLLVREFDVPHVPAIILVKRMEDRVRAAVEFERLDAKALAQLAVEHRRRLDPFPLQQQLGEARGDEHVRAPGPAAGRRGAV